MAKKKGAKSSLINRLNAKPKQKKLNPFEVHINKKKYDVVGKKSKTEKGLPGISRSRAIKKRKATLLHEYTLKNKVNQFVDRRIGERDSAMTRDDKLLARYTTERMRFHSRKSLYNLGDDEILTHRGESLAEIEKFDDPKSDDDDDDEREGNGGGKLGESFVSEAHFGGGILKRVDGDNKNRKDLIDQMIAESKKRKAEKQKLRELTLDMTEKLDTEWKDILPLVAGKKARMDETVTLKSDNKYLAYDKLSKELMFEARGKATDKLKSEAELAQIEKKQLEDLEKKRKERMLDDSTQEKKVKHKSADDLDDGFDFNYDGKIKSKKKTREAEEDGTDQPLKLINDADRNSSSEEEDSSSEEDEEDRAGDSNAEIDVKSEGEDEDVKVSRGENSSAEQLEDNEDGESDDSADTEDNLSDLKSSENESDDETATLPTKSSKKLEKKKLKKKDPTEKNAIIKSLKDLPFTLNVPETYDEFEDFFEGREAEYQAVVVERMIKTNHPSLPEGSRAKLVTLFGYCLQHLQDIATDNKIKKSSFKVLDRLAPWLYDLTHFATATASSMLSDVIKEKYEDYLKRPRRFPSVDTLIFLKLVGILYPTSDYRHRLVTPALVFMEHILASCKIQSSIDISAGLFFVTLILEYTALSKRLTPEAINFLQKVLRLSLPVKSVEAKLTFRTRSDFTLHVQNSYRNVSPTIAPLGVDDLVSENDSENFKLQAMNLCLQLLYGFCENFDKSSEYLILEPFVPLLTSNHFHESLKPLVQKVLDRILLLKKKKLYKLVSETKRPKPLKLYEPKIEDVYTFKKKRPMTKEKEEHDKLLYKYKKEVKGALREIRRDNSFISKLKYNETKASDLERQRKVKEIFGDAAQQAGDLNKLKRK